MKTLPDNPDLDHLRKQAKDLLAGLRESDPTASLADAQTALARQYGFRVWTDLKAEVDRRTGKAEFADADLTATIAERYGLGTPAGPMVSMSRSDEIGRAWSLTTDLGRWAVRRLDSWWPVIDLETEIALQDAAASAGIRLPAPVRSRTGSVVESIDDHDWRVNAWLHSGPPLAAPVGSATTRRIGAVLAKVHRLAMPIDRVHPWIARRLSDMSWEALAEKVEVAGADWAPQLTAAVPNLVDLETIGADTQDDPPVLCHNTLGPNQVRLDTDGDVIVFGWEHAGGQSPRSELGDALVHWTLDPDGGGVNAPAAAALVDGYRAEAGDLPRLDLGMFRGAIIGLANYVFGQVHEALDATDVEDRRHFDRSVRHLLGSRTTRGTLEELLKAARSGA